MPSVNIFGELVEDTPSTSIYDTMMQPSASEIKQDRLQQRLAEKLNRLSPQPVLGTAYKDEFYDADTIRNAKNVEDIRLGNVDSSKYNYINAPERKVTSPEDIARYNASRMALDNFAMGTTPASRESFQDIIANPLTPENQAIYDAEMAKLKGDPLTVTGQQGQVGVWGRQIGQVFNPNAPDAGESLQERLLRTGNAEMYSMGKPKVDTTKPNDRIATIDAMLAELDITAGNEGRLGETIDMGQAAVAKFGADTLNMLENIVGKENIAKYDAWASDLEKSLGMDGKVGIFIDEDVKKSIEGIRDLETAQREFGVSQETINAHNTAMQESAELWKNAESVSDYIKSLAVGMSQLDRILAGSAGEIASLAIPGGPAVVAATRTSNYAEEYEKNNNKPMDKNKLAQTFFTELALLIPEKLLIKSGITDLVDKTAGKTGVAGRLLTAGVGEGAQEYGEGISEVVATQKEGERTIGDIATDPETVHQAAIGFGMGAGLKGAGETLKAGKDVLGELANKGDKKLSKATTETPTATEETTQFTPVTENEREVSRASFNVIKDKLKYNTPLGNEDIDAIHSIEEIVGRYDNEAERTAAEASVTEIKRLMAEQLGTSNLDEKPIIFGAKPGSSQENQANDYIIDVLEGVDFNPNESLEAQLIKVAEANGVTKEQYNKVKTALQVEKEATIGKGGYKTYNTMLNKHLMAPTINKEATTKLVNKIKKFAASQERYVKTIQDKVSEVERIVNTYNKNNLAPEPKSQYKVTIPQDVKESKWVINVREVDGKYKIDESTYEILKTKQSNADSLNNILERNVKFIQDKLGVEPADIGIAGGTITIDTQKGTRTNFQTKRRIKDAKYLRDHKINKVITTKDSKWRKDGYREGNEKAINPTSYSANDNVLISIPKEMSASELKKELSVGSSDISKAINKATKVGATIILDSDINTEKHLGQIVNQLIKFKNYEVVKKEDGSPSYTYKPAADISDINKDIEKKVAEIKETKETIATTLREAAYNKVSGKPFITENVKSIIVDKFSGSEEKLNRFLDTAFEKEVASAVKDLKELALIIKKGGTVKSDTRVKLETKLDGVANIVKSKAQSIIDAEEVKIGEYSDLLNKYREALENGDIATAEEVLRTLPDNDMVNYALENSLSSGMEPVYRYSHVKDGKEVYSIALTKETLDSKKKDDSIVTVQEVDPAKIVKQGTPSFINSIAANTMGSTVSSYVNKFIKTLSTTLATNTIDKDSKVKGPNAGKIKLATDPARALMYSIDPVTGKEVINENIALALKLAIDEFVAFNSRMLDNRFKSDADIATMLGIDETSITNSLRNLLKDKGMFKKTLANSLGKATLSKLGLTRVPGIEVEVFDKLAADLGNMGVMAMLSTDNFQADTSINAARLNKALGREGGTDKDITFIKFTSEDAETKKAFVDDTKEMYEDIHTNVMDESAFRKEPSRSPIKGSKNANKVAKTTAGFTTSKTAEKVMNDLRAIEWKVDFEVINRLLEDEDGLVDWLGYREDTSDMSYYDAEGQISKNREILKSIEELKLAVESNNDKLFFDWFYTSNGRYMMDSNTLNPQTDKLHRFVIQPKDHTQTLTVKDGKVLNKDGKDITYEMDYALAQAVGFDVDKKSTKEIQKLGKALRSNKTAIKNLKSALSNHTEFKIAGFSLESEHISHAYQALVTLENMQGKSEFTTALTAETDAVTSGFALKLMQMPILGESIEHMFKWLNKVGVFRPKDIEAHGIKDISMNDVLSTKGFDDSYQTLAKNVVVRPDVVESNFANSKSSKYIAFDATRWEVLSKVLPQFDEAIGEVSKELRTLFKDPFMTFNYSAGMKSIRRSLTNVLTNKVVTKLINAKKDTSEYELLTVLSNDLGITKTALQVALNEQALFTIKNKEGNANLEAILNSYINAGYGSTVEDIMTSEFKEFTDAQKSINDAFKAMFQVFNKEYNEKIVELQKEKGFITNEDKINVINTLREKFPAIKGPLSDKDDMSDYVGIYRTRNVTPGDKGSRLDAPQTYLNTDKKGTPATNKVAYEIKAFEEAISAGSVVPIHYIDGALIGKLQSNVGNVFTAIHDAIMMPIGRIDEGAKEYNKQYQEVSMDYSFIAEIQNQLNNIDIKSLDDKYYKTIKDGTKDTLRTFITSTIKNFSKLSKVVSDRRAQLKDELDSGSVYMHMASLEDGVHYHNIDKESLGAATAELPSVIITPQQLAEITTANEKYIAENPSVVSEGDRFEYIPNTGKITVVSPAADNTVTDEEYQVYLAHEIRHAKTYQWLTDNKNSQAVVYLKNSLRKVASEFRAADSYKDKLLQYRLQYADGQISDINRVAEIVAILSSEPHIREQFIKRFPQNQQSKLTEILNAIKEFLGIYGKIDVSNMVPIIDSIVDGSLAKEVDNNINPDEEIYTQLGDRYKDAEATYWKIRVNLLDSDNIAPDGSRNEFGNVLSEGLLSELNTETNNPLLYKKDGDKGTKVKIVGYDGTSVYVKFITDKGVGKQAYPFHPNQVRLNQTYLKDMIRKYNSLGANTTPGISTQELAALKTLYQATTGPIKDTKPGIIPLLISGRAKTEALKLIEEARLKCKGN